MALSPAQEIKEKLDIAEFLRGYLTLIPAGRNMKALCPFHKEKTPSFMVSPERQSWYCFGCNTGGDIFSFLMKYENIEFGEALRVLAEKAGIELRKVSPQEYRQFGILYDINEEAKKFFGRALQGSEVAQKYLKERNLSKETVNEFELGWAPQGTDELTVELVNRGFAPEDIIRAGLSSRTARGLTIDRFRGRIIFPIHNHTGKTVGFTGRILPQFDTGDLAKYLNSPETPIFAKSKLLYGFWKSKGDIRESGEAFLVEGQTDFLMAWQAGIKNAVATSGTALTQDHLGAIRRFTDRLVLGLDSDEAGLSALERAIDLAKTHDFGVRVASLGSFKDPADAAGSNPEFLKGAIREAIPAPRFYFSRYLPSSEVDPRNRDHLERVRAVLGKLAGIPSPVERTSWVQELSSRTGIAEKILAEEIDRVARSSSSPSATETTSALQAPQDKEKTMTGWERVSEELLAAAVASEDFDWLREHALHFHPRYRPVFDILAAGEKKSEDENLDSLLNLIVLASRERDSAEQESLLRRMKGEYLKVRRSELALAAKRAEEKGDETALDEILQELSKLPAV